MKELENLQKDAVKIHAQAEKKKEVKFLGSQRKIKGLILWEFDLETKILQPARYKSQRVVLSKQKGMSKTRLEVDIKQKGLYIQALNRENAVRKLKKRLNIIIE
jgi:hypothetical protein